MLVLAPRNDHDEDMCLRRLKSWCVDAILKCDRAGHMRHMREYPLDAELRTLEALDRLAVERYGEHPVLPDAAAAPAAAPVAAAWGHKQS